jgi:hypothetical protein
MGIEREMLTSIQQSGGASTGRMALLVIGGFIALLMMGAIALWLVLGSTVFFELLAAGIAYCF